MARVNYVDESSHPELIEEIKAVRAQRRGKLIPVYGLLLNSPELALSWMQFLNAVRWKIKLSARLREMVILRVALHNKSEYVIDVHRKNFTESDGLSHDECDALLKKKLPQSSFSPEELSVIAYVDQLTLKANVDDEVFAGVKAHLSDRQLVELSVLIGAYNMHTRVMSESSHLLTFLPMTCPIFCNGHKRKKTKPSISKIAPSSLSTRKRSYCLSCPARTQPLWSPSILAQKTWRKPLI